MVKTLLSALFFTTVVFSSGSAVAATPVSYDQKADEVAHGGGCRKSSPPGSCCHKNRKTGEVHCH